MNKVIFLNRQFQHQQTIMIDEDVVVEDIVADAKITINNPFIKTPLKENGICLIETKGSTGEYFIGTVEKVTREPENGLVKVEIKHISEIFNIDGITSPIAGDIFLYLKGLIEGNFVGTTDTSLNLNIEVLNGQSGSYAINNDFKTNNIKTIIKSIFDISGTYLKYSIGFNDGKPEKIVITVLNNLEKQQIILKHNNPLIFELKRTYSNTNNNKIIFVPDAENPATQNYYFYLTKDARITQNQADSERFESVRQVVQEYSDSEVLADLQERAEAELLGKSYTHNITFNFVKNSSYPLDLYARVLFYDESGIYNTIVTKRLIQGDLYKITLGNLRLTLTEKLRISLTRSI